MKVHTELGPGLLENAYEECLFYELVQTGLKVEKQKALPLVYHEVKLDAGYRIDLLVANKVIVEIKAVEAFNDVHLAQILTYLKLSNCKSGLLINFNVKTDIPHPILSKNNLNSMQPVIHIGDRPRTQNPLTAVTI